MSRITSSALDRRLSDVLADAGSHAPMPDAVLEVPDAWVRARRSLGSAGRAAAVASVVTLAAATTVAIVALVATFGDRAPWLGTPDASEDAGVPIHTLDLEPQIVPVPEGGLRPIGPVVEVARGATRGMAPWSFTVYRAEESVPTELGMVCLFFEWPRGVDGACGAMPGEPGTIGEVFGAGGETHAPVAIVVHAYSGLVALNVAEVWIETDAGGRARARLIPLDAAEVDAQLFIAFLPRGVHSTAWVALDADGNEIGRIPDGARPPEDVGPIPTPAAVP